MNNLFEDAEVISRYTRAQAIADGVLIEASMTGKEVGFSVPVAITSAAWAEAITWSFPDDMSQDHAGRLFDVVYMARFACQKPGNEQRRTYTVARVPNEAGAVTPEEIELSIHIGGGDQGEPVITIMLPTED